MPSPDFMLNGQPVGYFLEPEYPRHDGHYRYMPYRGFGHYELQIALRDGRRVRCYFDNDNSRVSFAVRDCPEQGVLDLCEFQTSPRNAA
jgi:hypothetical protein